MGYYVSTLFVPLTPDELDNWFKAHAMLDLDPIIPVPEMGDDDSQPARYRGPAETVHVPRYVDLSKSSMTISQQCEEAGETGICADGQRCGPAYCQWCPNRAECAPAPVQDFGESDSIPDRYRCIDCKDPLTDGERQQCHICEAEDLREQELNLEGTITIELSEEDQHALEALLNYEEPAEVPSNDSDLGWNGPKDGLPPVGTVCEVDHCNEWKVCEVIAHFKQRVAMVAAFTYEYSSDGGKGLDSLVAECFRPLRRSEEDKAVNEMSLVIFEAGFDSGIDHIGYAEALYAAGYRKQEARS
ncbi:hypothetical protein [Marinobacterium lutimaris]|uniref:Uncharacterized protein n=1 Tax=Marinobacterium lutimaris TaxID=568106 RepID=A0A1H5XQD5_9GAMM|nr:hypothetical protein [Marinobacterium lutimaris]SEG13637.1 hypothetical protein SAMN05444390_1011457 [Marinobacterium lutimaris]